jgi:small subunit ribosomal protein S3e
VHPECLDDKGQRIRELTSVVQKRFDFSEGPVELYVERVQNRGLCGAERTACQGNGVW